MSNDIQRYQKRFLIISDTAMCRKSGDMYAFGPVVRELDTYHQQFSEIVWIGFNRSELQNDPVMIQVPSYVKCVLLPSTGGDKLVNKLDVLFKTPYMALVILYYILRAQCIHTRAPSVPSFIGVLYSFLFKSKIWWHKYAGNWWQINPPFFYNLQRKVLIRAAHTKVTINGQSNTQPSHCISFENPCITEFERREGKKALLQKQYNKPFTLCFVGRIEAEKGIIRLIEALKDLDVHLIHTLHIVGSGPLNCQLQELIKGYNLNAVYHGSLGREALNKIFAQSHFIVLPTIASEGFPKVLAEAANYGCIPIVSNISGIGMYIKQDLNGFLLNEEELHRGLLKQRIIDSLNYVDILKIATNAHQSVDCFTFTNFSKRLQLEIFK